MTPQQLFLLTLDDLAQRERTLGDEYALLMTAGLLRKLFMEGRSLLFVVNEEPRLTVRFTVSQPLGPDLPPGFPPPDFWAVLDGLDPATRSRPGSTMELNRDQLLNTVIMLCDGVEIRIRDVIAYLAYIEGAVHLGTVTKDREVAIENATRGVISGGEGALYRSMRSVIRVVLKGLAPLADRVRRDLQDAEPKILFAFIATEVDQLDEGLRIQGLSSIARVPEFPYDAAPASVVYAVQVPVITETLSLPVQIAFVHVDSGEVLRSQGWPYQAHPNPTATDHPSIYFTTVSMDQLIVKQPGAHKFVVYLRGQPMFEIPLWMELLPEDNGAVDEITPSDGQADTTLA